jgi:glycosyltransferase involved in cell wall biosynthesis
MSRIALVIPDYSVAKSMTTLSTAALLAESGFEVDVLTNVALAGCPTLPGVRFVSQQPREPESAPTPPEPTPLGRAAALLERRLGAFPGVRPAIASTRDLKWVRRLTDFAAWAGRQGTGLRTSLVIGCDPSGLIAAAAVALRHRAPLAYFSLELHLWRDCASLRDWVKKSGEALLMRRAAFTIIQDDERAAVLAADNRLHDTRFVLQPVASLGEASPAKSAFLRERLGIAPDAFVVLHAGGIYPWNRCLELAEAARRFPESWVLVLHGFPYDPAYVARIRAVAPPGKVMLSLDKLPFERMPDVIASADVGVALYEDRGPNFTLIGSASNRLVDYLRHGLPVLVSDFPSLRRAVEEHGCGVAVGPGDDLVELLERIRTRYEEHRRAALTCYDERYRAREHFPRLLAAVRELEPL